MLHAHKQCSILMAPQYCLNSIVISSPVFLPGAGYQVFSSDLGENYFVWGQWERIGGSRGREDVRPSGPIFFIFMQFLGKLGQIICWRPPLPLGLSHPPLGNPGSATRADASQ